MWHTCIFTMTPTESHPNLGQDHPSIEDRACMFVHMPSKSCFCTEKSLLDCMSNSPDVSQTYMFIWQWCLCFSPVGEKILLLNFSRTWTLCWNAVYENSLVSPKPIIFSAVMIELLIMMKHMYVELHRGFQFQYLATRLVLMSSLLY